MYVVYQAVNTPLPLHLPSTHRPHTHESHTSHPGALSVQPFIQDSMQILMLYPHLESFSGDAPKRTNLDVPRRRGTGAGLVKLGARRRRCLSPAAAARHQGRSQSGKE